MAFLCLQFAVDRYELCPTRLDGNEYLFAPHLGVILEEVSDFVFCTVQYWKIFPNGGGRKIQTRASRIIDGVEHRGLYFWKEGKGFNHVRQQVRPTLQSLLDQHKHASARRAGA